MEKKSAVSAQNNRNFLLKIVLLFLILSGILSVSGQAGDESVSNDLNNDNEKDQDLLELVSRQNELRKSKTQNADSSETSSWGDENEIGQKNSTSGDEDEITTATLIERAGFKVEAHTVTTEDGFLLTLYRIPPNYEKNEYTRVALFAHGLLAASDIWLVNSPEKSLPLILAKQGWDVWLSNSRGSFYSREHSTKSTETDDFWNFSFHDIGISDTPAIIDFILLKTNRSKLNYIGHSMGTTALYVMLSERPEYNDKINMSVSLAPLAYMNNVRTPLIRAMAYLLTHLPKSELGDLARNLLTRLEFWPRYSFLSDELVRTFCKNGERRRWCKLLLFSMTGFDFCQSDQKYYELLETVFPSGASIKTIVHYAQIMSSGAFQQFDNGMAQNNLDYDQSSPRAYNLSNIRARQVLFYADNDWLSHPQDVAQLASELQGPKEICRVKFRQFNHIDFLLAKDVNILLNDRVVRVLDGESCSSGPEHNLGEDPNVKCDNWQDYNFVIPPRLRSFMGRLRPGREREARRLLPRIFQGYLARWTRNVGGRRLNLN